MKSGDWLLIAGVAYLLYDKFVIRAQRMAATAPPIAAAPAAPRFPGL